MDFTGGPAVKNLACKVGDTGSIPGWETKVPHGAGRLCPCTATWEAEILQARILEWIASPFSKGSSQTRDQTQVSRIAGGFFTSWATREAHCKDVVNTTL